MLNTLTSRFLLYHSIHVFFTFHLLSYLDMICHAIPNLEIDQFDESISLLQLLSFNN